MKKKTAMIATKTIAYSAMLTAISVVLARLIIPMPNEFTRFSIEAVPIFLAGMFFGPVVGGCVGFAADLVGCLFSAYGYNPIYCVPPVLYGICGGILYCMRKREAGLVSIGIAFAVPVIAGSILYQSWALGMMMGKGFVYFLSTRSIQFAITYVLDVAIVYFLIKSRIFHRMGLLSTRKDKEHDD